MIFCAELGSNHKGQESLAFEMIQQFAPHADILKFQLGHAENDPIRYVDHIAPKLKFWCDWHNTEFMASIWSLEALDLARSLDMKRYKIAHQIAQSDNAYDKRLVTSMIKDGKEIFISGVNEWVYDFMRPIYVSPEYPTYPENLNMPSAFSDWYGYSDHTHGIAAPLMAIARGAKFVEVHCTLDKTEESIRDNHFACTPEEFALLVKLGKQITRLA
jgi:sialic acid synthase SpsE